MRPWLTTPFGEVSAHTLFSSLGVIVACVVFFALNRRRDYALSVRVLALFLGFVLFGGFLGARVLFLLVSFPADPSAGIAIGTVFYGGLLGGLGGGYLASRLYGLPFLRLLDLAAMSLPLGHALGRVGCFLAGCCYGVATESVFGVVYPAGHPTHPSPTLPVQLFEAAFNVALFSLLLFLFHRRRAVGTYRLPALYLIMYPAFRFINEFFRADPIRGVHLLSTSQWLSIPLFLAGLYLLLSRPPHREAHQAKG